MQDVQYVVHCCMGAVSIEMENARRVQNGEAKLHMRLCRHLYSDLQAELSYKICSNRGTSYKNCVNHGTFRGRTKIAKSAEQSSKYGAPRF